MARKRSPAYPAIDLKTAIDRARSLYATEHENLVPLESVLASWKLSVTSGGGMAQIAALRYYGLLEQKKSKTGRQVKLSALALDIILDDRENSGERQTAIRQAALKPTLHAELWEKWGANLPSDQTFRHYLLRDRGFNSSYVGNAIETYKDTFAFAKLGECDIIDDGERQAVDEVESAMVSRGPIMPTSTVPEGRVVRPRQEPNRDEGAAVTCDLPGGNLIEIRLRRKVSPSDFEYLRKVFEVAEFALVDHSKHDPNPLDDSDEESTETQRND